MDTSNVELPGTRAVEVAALFEDSVVRVTHLSDPRPPEPIARSTAWIAGGTAALVSALVLFVCAYAHLPTGGVWGDMLGAALVFGGTFALASGLKRRARARASRDFTVGTSPDAHHAAPEGALPADAFPLVRAAGDGWELVFTRGMQGDVTAGGATLSLADLIARGNARPTEHGAFAWPIADGARAFVQLGLSSFHVSSVAAPRTHEKRVAIDVGEQSYIAGCALAAAAFLALIHAIPPDPRSLAIDDLMKDKRFPVFTVKAPDVPESPSDGKTPVKSVMRGGKRGGGAHKGPGGKMGTPRSSNKDGLYAIKGPAGNKDWRLARATAAEMASKAGIIGIWRETSQIGSVFSPHETALDDAAETVMGGLIGTQTQDANGVEDGLGVFGKDPGGGGTHDTIGLTNLPTVGFDGKDPRGSRYVTAGRFTDKKKDAIIEPTPGPTRVTTGLDKEIVRRVVRKHLNEVRFCYEKRLHMKPDLYGRVLTEFSIAGTGKVIASLIKQSTLSDVEAEQCIQQAVARWEFPKPEATGLVIVQYPFSFKQVGN
jgi:hypothetical protein